MGNFAIGTCALTGPCNPTSQAAFSYLEKFRETRLVRKGFAALAVGPGPGFSPSRLGGHRHGPSANWARSPSVRRKTRASNESRCASRLDQFWACGAGFVLSLRRQRAKNPGRRWRCLERCCLRRGHDLSDVMWAEALSKRASFRRFCGFTCGEAPPSAPSAERFRRLLLAHGLDRSLIEASSKRSPAILNKGRHHPQGHLSAIA
jgi:Transposase domain (DUF772)